jgi:alpha-tubulin suppressor-like RCC1 family protein
MTRTFRRTPFLVFLLIAAGGCATATAPDDPPGDGGSATGLLTVTISGIPSGTNAAVTVTGPGSFSQVLSASGTLNALVPGTYTVSSGEVTVGAASYLATAASQTATVVAGQVATSTVTYVAQVGDLMVSITGLPGGVAAAVQVTGPGGFAQTLSASATLADLPVGEYAVAAEAVMDGSDSYSPSATSQLVTVVLGQTVAASVDHALASGPGALYLEVTGLPGGVAADLTVNGPAAMDVPVNTSATLGQLTPGEYTVTAEIVSFQTTRYGPDLPSQTVTVMAGQTAQAAIDYDTANLIGSLTLTVTGLPGGVDANVTVTGPGSYSAAVTATETLAGLVEGQYLVTSTLVASGGTNYTPTPDIQSVAVVHQTQTDASVVYSAVILRGAVRDFSLGEIHACGLDQTGTPYCWGNSNSGQVGTGIAPDVVPAPVQIAGGPYVEIEASLGHTCGLTANGAAFCWGDNLDGEIGVGPIGGEALVPTPVSFGSSFSQISVGGAGFSCGLDDSGSAWCWGRNDRGQLGDGTTTNRGAPTQVVGGYTFREVRAGDRHACGLENSGLIRCWGDNLFFRLGVANVALSTAPVLVTNAPLFEEMTVGGSANCGLTVDGAAYCWGGNFVGELGNVGAGNSTMTPTVMLGDHVFQQIVSAGSATCGLDTAGQAWCTGDNTNGQLGDGTQVGRVQLTAVGGGVTFTGLIGGPRNTCGVDGAGQVWCWGRNDFGQLGNGATGDESLPVQVLPFM